MRTPTSCGHTFRGMSDQRAMAPHLLPSPMRAAQRVDRGAYDFDFLARQKWGAPRSGPDRAPCCCHHPSRAPCAMACSIDSMNVPPLPGNLVSRVLILLTVLASDETLLPDDPAHCSFARSVAAFAVAQALLSHMQAGRVQHRASRCIKCATIQRPFSSEARFLSWT